MKLMGLALLGLLSTSLLFSGCGGAESEGRKKVFKVKGKVTMSGGPLIGASVAFAPREGQPVAIGRTNDLGEYTLTTYEQNDGAAAGRFAVVIKKVASTESSASTDEHGPNYTGGHNAQVAKTAGGGNLIPAKYGDSNDTPLAATVEEKDENVFDFDLN